MITTSDTEGVWMKPLGTITKYFPFVDDETRSIVESIMSSAYNYHDFVFRLVERVCTEESLSELVHLAVIHKGNLGEDKLHYRLREKYYHTPIVRPYLLLTDATLNETPSLRNDAKSEIEAVLASNPDEWVAYMMHSLAWGIGGITDPGGPYQTQVLDKMKQLIRNNKDLSCFEEGILTREVSMQTTGGQTASPNQMDYRQAAKVIEQAYELAIDIDDLVRACGLLATVSYYVRNFDTTRALNLLSKAEDMANQLGLPGVIRHSKNLRGTVHLSRGEFNASLDCFQAFISIAEKAGAPTITMLPHNLAWAYNEMGKGEEALEWAMMALDTAKAQPKDLPHAYFDAAHALVNIGRLREAREYLEEAQRRGLKIANEIYLQSGHLISGLLDMAEGRHLDAMQSFEKSFEICERLGRQNRLNSSLLRLTECELVLFESNEETKTAESSGHWMERLEREVAEKEIPGIRGRLLLLKAELCLRQGRRDDAEALLREVRTLAENPHMSYLGEMISNLRAQADQLES
jgi:tetratricopeptide (TPR) repeat protein